MNIMNNVVSFDTLNDLINSTDVREGMVVYVLGKNDIFDSPLRLYKTISVNDLYEKFGGIINKVDSIVNKKICFVEVSINSQNELLDKVSSLTQEIEICKSLINTLMIRT